ncbi:HAD family hydrolase [Sulfuriflexus mobilis]|uniref:HAD family hydrolase n=1 Tax=Sulfuriflexus mobilis TaxID=1811807 RepID=UPI001E333C7F|nr:HAD family hydrolase [Sulfuriflexus mobilis]
MIRAVCFDLFHTLVDVGRSPGTPGRYTADILGLDREDWNRVCFSSAHEICQATDYREVVRQLAHSLDPTIPQALLHEAADERKARFDYTLRHVEAGVLEHLWRLRGRGLKLALISNASTGEVDAWPDSPLADCFDTTVFSCHCGHAKPDAAIYQQALRQLAVQPAEAAFVGDGGSQEHAGASALGMHSVLLTHFVAARLDKAAMDHRRRQARHEIAGLDELLPLLDRLGVTM